jgi:hypothetical protein
MDAPRSIADLEQVLRSSKRLEGTLAWKPQHRGAEARSRGARLRLVAALSIGDVVLEGVSFLATAPSFEPDRAVAMQLMVKRLGKERPFCRIDWRGAPHTNRNQPQSSLNLRAFDGTHIHRLTDNAFLGWPGIVATREDLPVADATPPLEDFRKLITYVAIEFAIENADQIREPPWEPLLSDL